MSAEKVLGRGPWATLEKVADGVWLLRGDFRARR